MQKPGPNSRESPSHLIDAGIAELGDWRGEMLSHVRRLITRADPRVVEEWKWEAPAIDLREGDVIDEAAFEALVRETVALNASAAR